MCQVSYHLQRNLNLRDDRQWNSQTAAERAHCERESFQDSILLSEISQRIFWDINHSSPQSPVACNVTLLLLHLWDANISRCIVFMPLPSKSEGVLRQKHCKTQISFCHRSRNCFRNALFALFARNICNSLVYKQHRRSRIRENKFKEYDKFLTDKQHVETFGCLAVSSSLSSITLAQSLSRFSIVDLVSVIMLIMLIIISVDTSYVRRSFSCLLSPSFSLKQRLHYTASTTHVHTGNAQTPKWVHIM